jgi:hypothetical protein
MGFLFVFCSSSSGCCCGSGPLPRPRRLLRADQAVAEMPRPARPDECRPSGGWVLPSATTAVGGLAAGRGDSMEVGR